jgi:hypothetical protein
VNGYIKALAQKRGNLNLIKGLGKDRTLNVFYKYVNAGYTKGVKKTSSTIEQKTKIKFVPFKQAIEMTASFPMFIGAAMEQEHAKECAQLRLRIAKQILESESLKEYDVECRKNYDTSTSMIMDAMEWCFGDFLRGGALADGVSVESAIQTYISMSKDIVNNVIE